MDAVAAAQIEAAYAKLTRLWPHAGACRSCGWHAGLSEYTISATDVVEALETDGILRLPCLNKDDEDRSDHRGVVLNLA